MTMSIAMANGLNALMGVNSSMADLQAQATSGKKVSQASDGLASFLSAKTYSQRADRLQNVNDTLSNNMQTIKAAQTGLDSIRKTITDTLDTLKAASQTQSYVVSSNATDTATQATSGTQIGFVFGAVTNNGATISNAPVTTATALAGGQIGNNLGASVTVNGQKLAIGQVFTINNTAFRISGAGDNVVLGDGSGKDANNAKNVTTVGDFLAAVVGAFGANGSMSAIASGQNLNFAAGGSYKTVITNNNQAAGASNTVTFGQTAGAGVSLQNLFSGARAKPSIVNANYTSDDQTAVINNQFSMTGNDHTVSAGTGGQAADSRRAAAAKSYNLAIDQINQFLKNASVSGTNLLNGDNLKMTFDEKGNSSLFQILDNNNAAMTFGAIGLGLADAKTGASADVSQNFQTNDDSVAAGNPVTGLNSAITKLTNSLSTLGLGDAQVAQFQATTQNRVDFNKSIIGLLNDAGNSLTAADMTQVSAQYAALQVQQSFAQTIMSNTKQSDQSVMQLLR